MSITVSGGAYSIDAEFDRLLWFAEAIAGLGRALLDLSRAAATCGLDPIRSVAGAGVAVLDPAGTLAIESRAALLAAVCGEAGLLCESLAAAVRAGVEAYRECDTLSDRAAPILRAVRDLPGALLSTQPDLLDVIHPDRVARGARGVLDRDPELPALLFDGFAVLKMGPGSLIVPGRERAPIVIGARTLSALYDDGTPVVERDPGAKVSDRAPRSMTDVWDGMAERNLEQKSGAVDVRIVRHRDLLGVEHTSAIVDITGTRDWNVLNRANSHVADTTTNLAALGNRMSSYERGVVQAIRASGVDAHTPVMLVGHSQGGMVAARLAVDARVHGLNVTHVVTAGSPIGNVEMPRHVQVLSIENKGDVVPRLDASDNPVRSNWITVGIDHGRPTAMARHSLSEGYLPGIPEIDHSSDPSIREWIGSAASFLDGDSVRTDVYTIRRQP
ncbi:hypothetical protein M6D93_03630 [Jatrophihabitans telluris]|uniref:GPI inositol-deacylase PGAP1-like alpha/beta domain-containing protein n=1 Tax=Jatrophihabitans telluris TaxID=2038343 RepID=A0ABY4R035_9ACTN|nr:hypothetical protein [Jatrophihabitans telluris]UQX89099.1 hypothetical protein M6D93_03630 [Jatrophihabitans telluris]